MNENKVVALLYRILKQMVMKYLDPKADLTFKKIFGNHPDRLRNLLYVLQSPNEDELIHLQQYLPSVEELEIPGFKKKKKKTYDKFWDSVSVERTLLDDRYQKGREEGREEGMNQRSLEIARNMLAKGMAASTVLEITGLSMEEIQ